MKVVRSLEGDKAREGLRTAAWNTLLRAHTSEKDGRVLEALKVGQVGGGVSVLVLSLFLSNICRHLSFLVKNFDCFPHRNSALAV